MSVVTINGPIGCGAIEVGKLVSANSELNYVDRLVFSQAAKMVGAPVPDLINKEQRYVSTLTKVANFLQDALEKSAISGISGEPYFGRGIEMLPAETYTHLISSQESKSQKLKDSAFIEATSQVIQELAESGSVVIIGRGSNLILKEFPGVIHVGMVGSIGLRVETMMKRELLDSDDAETYVENLEKARVGFFKKFFKVHPDDPSLYDFMINMDVMSHVTASDTISYVASLGPAQ
ncbi:MAG TPA: hypothetical protein DEZ08_06670 [Dehalococcoidia bacterium]|jgi:cytidylate kinase|nr:hypothetical protein [Dehalococcoidia bacterium]|tara:strand:+ start:2117 stop:2821 length:705 start_codon:yes stop_codon:yes gene_type:complete